MNTTSHPYNPNVPNCSKHDMGDCPHHDGGPCMYWRDGGFCGKPEQDHGRTAVTGTGPTVWTPGTRLPIGQYRVTLLVTGDAVGPEILSWLIADRTARMGGGGLTAHVEQIETIERDGR
jgi:hypothetical protein